MVIKLFYLISLLLFFTFFFLFLLKILLKAQHTKKRNGPKRNYILKGLGENSYTKTPKYNPQKQTKRAQPIKENEKTAIKDVTITPYHSPSR